MSCTYGPYKITSNLEAVSEFAFIDHALSRRVVAFVNCSESVTLPCVDAAALHVEDGCPEGCKILWYECPSEMGRQYTILPTPCGVKITSFENGLIATDSCDATQFGSELFCFGKTYTNLGIFNSPDKSATTFEFDGHGFTVKGMEGDCNELYGCPECQINSQVTTFEDLPTPPEDASAPEPPTTNDPVSDIDVPETIVIPAEGRSKWHWDATTSEFGTDTLCEEEKPLTSWAGGSGEDLDDCFSNDNPSIATLPSGHTVVAYENRREDGIAKISVAILSSSVGENIRSHRKLGTGTLINDLVEAGGVATFIVYEDMHIPVNGDFKPQADERIGFLTGPLAGSLFSITRLERIRSGDTIRHEFEFAAPPNTIFPDKNNVYDVNWFIVDNQGDANLPSSENVTTILDLPNHVDGEGNAVPVANPSVAVAQNNQMVANEQNIYIAYQAFENNEWRVYLREIILGTGSRICSGGENDGSSCSDDSDCPDGTCSDGIPPAYVAPYLFDEDVRQIEIMSAAEPVVKIMGEIPAITFYNETFSAALLFNGLNISATGRWVDLTDIHIPTWEWRDPPSFPNTYTTRSLILCDGRGPFGATGLPATNCGAPDVPCSVVFNSQICEDVGVDDSNEIFDHTRSFAVNTTPTEIDSKEVLDLSFRMRFHIVIYNSPDIGEGIHEYPEIWFLIGRDSAASTFFGRTDYRLQIRRGRNLSDDSMNNDTSSGIGGLNSCRGCQTSTTNCFIFSLYTVKSPKVSGMEYFFDVVPADGSLGDVPTRVLWKCLEEAELEQPGDYSFDDWNEWRVDTYSRGNYRFFDIYLTHPNGTEVLMASFREWDWSFELTFSPDLSAPLKLGKYHGFGVVQISTAKHQVLIDNFSVSSIPRTSNDKIFFFEDFCTRDELISPWASITNVNLSSPAMSDEGINTNIDYDTSEMSYQDNLRGDQFYPMTNTKTRAFEQYIQLGPATGPNPPPTLGYASYLRLGYASVDRSPAAAGTSYYNSVSMVVSVNRVWKIHNGAWPHVWFVGRLSDSDDQWHSRYRLRISRFNCVSAYPGLGLNQNDQVWRLSAYNSGTGLNTDIAAAETFLKIGEDTTLDWTEYSPVGGGGGAESQAIWNYFKIDMYDNAGSVVFDVYTGDDTATDPQIKVHQDDINYSLLGSLSVSPRAGVDGPYFGLALFSGASEEYELSNDDYRSSAYLNYLTLSTIGAPGEPPRGACCREIGGCTEDVLSADCQGNDIWRPGLCSAAGCEVDFPVGAGCTSDGFCHGGITAAEAIIQGVPDVLCPEDDCAWIAGKDCNGGATDRLCPEAITDGSCCRQYKPDGVTPACVDNIMFEQCFDYYGSDPGAAFRLGVDCTDSCPIVAGGACCLSSGCYVTTSSNCAGQGGTFYDGHDCTSIITELSITCDEGACCDGVGGCTEVTESECDDLGVAYSFLGVGVSCTVPSNPCVTVPDIYACCYEDGDCTNTIESICVANSGTWISGSLCGDITCATPTGACCEGFTGDCINEVTSAVCLGLVGHTYLGDGSTCTNANCPQPTGACCVGFECIGDRTVEQCASLGGSYLSNFANCIEGTCADGIEDPYLDITINYKPEDLWVIETAPNQYVTRVLYHMQEKITVSSLQIRETGSSNMVDFMFLIDHSNSMLIIMNAISVAVPELASQMISKGLDVRFGFTFFGRGEDGSPRPTIKASCGSCNGYIANGLQVSSTCRQSAVGLDGVGHDNGFTRNTDYLQQALNCWGAFRGDTSPWSAINYALEDSEFVWRENASKYVFFVTDAPSNECRSSCDPLTHKQLGAVTALLDARAVLIPVVDLLLPSAIYYEEVAEASGWTGGTLDVHTNNYGELFEQVSITMDTILRIDHATIVERSASGTDATYLKKGEVIITYDDDLSDLWTFNKDDFEFSDLHVPFPGTNTKQIDSFPFDLASGKIYGIDSVHIQGDPNNWVSFGTEGALIYSHPDVGRRASGTSEFPVLISTNSAHPSVYVNGRNQVMVAYESYVAGASQIEIKGTGDFHQNSITGPKSSRITRLLNLSDFAYSHAITLPGDGVNQLCDFVIDNSDITHVVWQSNRDGYWEIYYANSFNMFEPVRVTQFESRSSHPSIDIDETGNIFVVYHDDRFGPFNIMLSSKDEERVIPLLEQDAYLASLRTGYTHYTNILPVFLDNPSGETPSLGQFWGSKKQDGSGNENESFIYKLDETTGVPSDGVNLGLIGGLGVGNHSAIAFSSTAMWGLTEGTSGGEIVSVRLWRLGNIVEDIVNVVPDSIENIDFNILDFVDHTLLDMAVDKFDRIWVLIYERESVGEGSSGFAMSPSGLPLVQSFAVNHRLRLEYISGFDASTIARGFAVVDLVGEPDGGSLAITPDNMFHITWSDASTVKLSSSSYPSISEGVATFDFQDIGDLTPAITPVAMTSDALGSLFVVSSGNDLYTISRSTAATTFQTSLTSGSGEELALPVGTTAGIAYQLLEVTETGTEQFFHIRVDFYDNIALEGNAILSIDSRDNLEAFINQETFDDPYSIIGMDARGIFLELDQTGIVFFDATHFVPGFSRLSQPYSFEPNQTYFPRVFQIDETSLIRESGIAQPNSFSCTKCSRFGNNNFNSSACSYSFVMPNPGRNTESFNFQIDFYADTGKQHLIRRFEAIPGSDDLQYMEVDNKPAIDEWTKFGLPIGAGDSAFVQIHPVLDPTAGFLCGVTYTVQVNECHSIGEGCVGFTKIAPFNWMPALVGDGEIIDDQLATDEIMLGLSMKKINDKLCVAWRTSEGFLKFSQFDGSNWLTQVVSSVDKTVYCDLADINGFPSISHVARKRSGDQHSTKQVLTLESGSWNTWSAMTGFISDTLVNPTSLLEHDNAPMVSEIGTGNIGQAVFTLNSGRSVTFDEEAGCFPLFAGGTGGSCTTTLANINGSPAVAWQSSGVKYAVWNSTSENFVSESIVSGFDTPVNGKVALAEVNGQPAVAYLDTSGNGAQLKYKRFDGNTWINTPTGGEIFNFNKHIAMAAINGQPYIVYSIKTSPTTSQLRYTFYNGSKFVDELIEDGLNQVDHTVDIIEWENEPAVIISANPFRVYFFRQQTSDSVNEIRSVFFCECSSKIFTNRLTHLNEVARWESSAHGFSDTQITDSAKNSVRPVMRTRKPGAAIVLWEDYNKSNNCTEPPCIRAATFRSSNQDQLRASGTKHWFDYDFGISGKDPDIAIDILDRVNSIYEKPKPSSPEGLHGRQLSINELPGNEIYGKVCDFLIAEDAAVDPGACDLSSLENNVISFDQFISRTIVRKIRVKENFVQYYTYNASGVLTPIVSTCNIALEIHGTPEVVALRFRNEDKTLWGPWCPWSPQISDFVMERNYKLSGGSGVKEVCIQAMTYKGITTEFCLSIVADYETVVFETVFYKSTDSDGALITNFSAVDSSENFETDDTKLVRLPLSEGISVANLAPEGGVLINEIVVLVEIIPNQEFAEELGKQINFDVLQQGTNDQRGRPANRGKNNEGRVLYRGDFMIKKEDKVSNVDGLARVNPAFLSACSTDVDTINASGTYTRDAFNEIVQNNVDVETTEADSLAEFRQTTSGRIGVNVDTRSSEDPYFVFGDPNYSLKKEDGQRSGVPFRAVQTEISIGETPDQDGGTPEGETPG